MTQNRHSARIAYYITAHGYGHAVRSCDILAALVRARPDLPITITSDLPRDFLAARLPPGGRFSFRQGRFDVGMVQLDSIRVDVAATLREVEALRARATDLLAAEIEFMRASRIGAVVADIPALPIRAGSSLGLPTFAVGNFAWDWIYEEFVPRDPRWASVADWFREAYGKTGLLLRLPFAEPMTAFPRTVDLPLLARPGVSRRDEIARRTGADPGKPWVLLSFSSLDWDAAALARVGSLRDYAFFTVKPLAWEAPGLHALDRRDIAYTDVLASCDIVVTKPGYGVLSECAVNGKPIVYSERTDFREYPILEAAVRRYFRHRHIPAEALYRGDLKAALDAVQRAPAPSETLAVGGDTQAASLILSPSRS